jgi:hypothetical protein
LVLALAVRRVMPAFPIAWARAHALSAGLDQGWRLRGAVLDRARYRLLGPGQDAVRGKRRGVAEDRQHVVQTLTCPTYRPVLQRA